MKKILMLTMILIGSVIFAQESWNDAFEAKFSVYIPDADIIVQMNESRDSVLSRVLPKGFTETERIINTYEHMRMAERDGNSIGFTAQTGPAARVTRIFIQNPAWYFGDGICIGMSFDELVSKMSEYPGKLYLDRRPYRNSNYFYINYQYYIPELNQVFIINFSFDSYDMLYAINFYTNG